MRVPFLAQFPGTIPAGQVCNTMATTLDILPTAARFAGASLPSQPLDGVDIMPVLSGTTEDVPREAFLYFSDMHLQAARMGPWKLHVSRFNTPAFCPDPARGRVNLPLPSPELYNVVADPQESYDRADRNATVMKEIQASIHRQLDTLPPLVTDAWHDTIRRRVQETPAGAFPVERSPE